MATDFPTKGDDKKISLRNSNYPQFDFDFASNIKQYNKNVWGLGGNIRGNEAYQFWKKARNEEMTQGTIDWIKEREAWAARHFEDGSQFKSGKLEPNKSNVGGVIAQMKWGVIGTLGEQRMKDVVLELVKKLEGKKDDERGFSDLSESVQKALRKKVDDHNEEYGDDPTKRATVRMLAAVFERGVGAYTGNPSSVRPAVTSAEMWAFARCNSFLFALRNGRFQGGKHDTDLFPFGHPLSSKERGEKDMDDRQMQIIMYKVEVYSETDEDGNKKNKFRINGENTPILEMHSDCSYYFDLSDESLGAENNENNHQLKLSTTENGTHGGGEEYTEGVTEGGTVGEAGAFLQIDVSEETPDLYYYCVNHSGMGNMIKKTETMMDNMDESTDERFDSAHIFYRVHKYDDSVVDEVNRVVQVGVSSEAPVKRQNGNEIIDHTRENMNLEFINSGRAPLLLDHDMEKMIGVVQSVELDETKKQLRAEVRFSKNQQADEVYRDLLDGIRQNISVGYRVDGRIETNEDDDENYYRVATTPMEISVVSIPADQSNLVGVGRSITELQREVTEMSEEKTVDVEAVRAEATKQAQKNAKEIMTLARKHNKADMGEEALSRGVSIEEFRGELLERIEKEPLETPAHVVDAPVKDQRQYSFGKMVRAQVTGDWSEAGFEREMHDEIKQRTGKASRGIYVPDFAWRSGAMSTAATGAVGSENVVDNFIPTIQRGDMFIEALRAKQVMARLGVTIISGLTNRIQMPKFSAGASAGFVEELGSVADQSQTDAAVSLQPRTMGAFVDIGRLALKESVPALDQVVQDDLLRSLAGKMEQVAINGSGSSGEPTGILNASGVGNVDISADTDVAALTWADITDIVKTVEDADAVVNEATLGWLSNPKVKAKMANTVRVSSTDSVMLLNEPWNNIYGFPAEFTTNVPSNLNPGDSGTDASALIFGDFSQVLVGMFGAPDILVDETTGGLAGTVRIIVHQDMDIGLRNAESFAKTDEVSTA